MKPLKYIRNMVVQLISIAIVSLLPGFSSDTAAQPVEDENGQQLHIVYLDDYLVEQVDASDQPPMRPASDPLNAEDWRGWHKATTRAVVSQLEAQYEITAVSMTSHIMSTFSAYLSPETVTALYGNEYVTEIYPVSESDTPVFSGPSDDDPAPGTVTVFPELPGAYEPFEFEIGTRSENSGTLIALNVKGSVISIEHQTDSNSFDSISRGGVVTVTFPGLPAGEYIVENKEFDASGSGYSLYPFTPIDLTIDEPPPTVQVYSLYLPGIRHYFITASEDEYEEVENYTRPVDAGFNAWAADGAAPTAAMPVCRFYSPSVNSHFYTADAAECESLKAEDSGWTYEGIAFQALVPTSGGTCMSGTTPVWRLYNNRHVQQDSNHRFVASLNIYNAMIADGWAGEGVAFCSPPPSE